MFPAEKVGARKADPRHATAFVHGLVQEFSTEYHEDELTIAWRRMPRHGVAKPIESVRALLAAQSPDERALPAWLDRHASQEAFPLLAPNSQQAVRVVQFDREHVRALRSRVEARTIDVTLSASLTCQTPAIHRAVYQAFLQLDWPAFARLLEP